MKRLIALGFVVAMLLAAPAMAADEDGMSEGTQEEDPLLVNRAPEEAAKLVEEADKLIRMRHQVYQLPPR